jgi:hypothetical protein
LSKNFKEFPHEPINGNTVLSFQSMLYFVTHEYKPLRNEWISEHIHHTKCELREKRKLEHNNKEHVPEPEMKYLQKRKFQRPKTQYLIVPHI